MPKPRGRSVRALLSLYFALAAGCISTLQLPILFQHFLSEPFLETFSLGFFSELLLQAFYGGDKSPLFPRGSQDAPGLAFRREFSLNLLQLLGQRIQQVRRRVEDIGDIRGGLCNEGFSFFGESRQINALCLRTAIHRADNPPPRHDDWHRE